MHPSRVAYSFSNKVSLFSNEPLSTCIVLAVLLDDVSSNNPALLRACNAFEVFEQSNCLAKESLLPKQQSSLRMNLCKSHADHWGSRI